MVRGVPFLLAGVDHWATGSHVDRPMTGPTADSKAYRAYSEMRILRLEKDAMEHQALEAEGQLETARLIMEEDKSHNVRTTLMYLSH